MSKRLRELVQRCFLLDGPPARRGRRALLLCLGLAGPLVVAGCATPRTRNSGDARSGSQTAYVVAGGWHTEIGLPVAEMTGPLAAIGKDFPAAQTLIFGWGARDFYMAEKPDLGDLISAIWSGPAVTLVRPLAASPVAGDGTRVFALRLSREESDRLALYIWSSLTKDQSGAPLRVGSGPSPGSIFYASPMTYDLTMTCNSWTAQALHAAGLPVTAEGVVFARQVLDQVRPIAARPIAPEGSRLDLK